jgi:hypothetical protein
MLATGRERVTIDGREFELGAIYGPQKGSGSRWRKLVAFEPSEHWCGGKVVTQIISPTALRSSRAGSANSDRGIGGVSA